MSIQASFAILQTLHVVDQRIGKLEVKLGSERAGISDKSERHAALLARVAKIESIIVTMEGTRNELNQELRQHLNQVDKAREKMTRCRNEKEANAAQREMEEVRRMSKEREMELQKLVGLITDARADVQAMETERVEVSSHIDETEGLAAVRVRELEADLAEQKKKRQAALGQLPASVQSRYLAVHNRRGSGTAAIVDGTCVACHISLSPMLFQELMRMQEFFQCANCHRLLYVSDSAGVSGASDDSDSESDEQDAGASA